MKPTLTNEAIQQFIKKGFVRIDHAFSKNLAAAGRAILWRDTGCDPNDPATWTKPVVRLGGYEQEPFREAMNTPVLHAAFDQLVGTARWEPRQSLGTFPIRFPHPDDPGDAGWHVDASFERTDGSWGVNVFSKGRALLMLFLFSDVEMNDAPTRILVGSHLEVAKILEPAGEEGLSFMELAKAFDYTKNYELAYATGEAGTVYLCHPFLMHAAQHNHGTKVRFLAQPPLYPAQPLQLERRDGNYSPLEKAIRLGLK